jgi:5-methyltetrahydrofolate--homocysteine methyltransferase
LQRGVLLLDGGLGTMLIEMGLAPGQAPEAWVLEHPDRVREAHRRYFAAGCHLVHAVSFGGTRLKLAAAGLGARCAEINRRAIELAREVAPAGGLCAGDVGPTGLLFPPMGEAEEARLEASFREQCALLAEAGADLLSIETMYDLREALAAVRAAVATGLPVLCSMTFDAKRRGAFTMVGDPLAPSLAALRAAGAHAVGMNCSVTSGPMLAMVAEARAALGPAAAIVAQPNAGQPRPTPEGIVYDADPEAFAADLRAMAEAGAGLLGGCCGTDERFLSAARAALGSRLSEPAG